MKRESFIFYKSFYDSIKELAPKEQVQIYNAIFEYQFFGEQIELKGVCKSIFTLILPQLEANNKKYENGKKGGRPKSNKNETKTKPKINQNETKTKPNVNDNENENVNVNDNDNYNDNVIDTNTSTIFDFIEKSFGRTLNFIEYEEISSWEDNELTRYAIKQAILNSKYNIKYISRILESYRLNNIKTVQEAQQEEEEFKKKKETKATTKNGGKYRQSVEEFDAILDKWVAEGEEDEQRPSQEAI